MRLIMRTFFLITLFLTSFTIDTSMHAMRRIPTYPGRVRVYDTHTNEIVGAIATVGFLAAAGYGIYKFCQWLFTKTDEQIVKEATEILYQNNRAHEQIIQFFESGIAPITNDTLEQKQVINTINESLLDQLHVVIGQEFSSIEVCIHRLENSISQLLAAHDMLQARISKLHKFQGAAFTITQMEGQDNQILALATKIRFILAYLQSHAPYYKLAQSEQYVLEYYQNVLLLLGQFENDSTALIANLKLIIMRHAAQSHSLYPYKDYIEALGNTLSRLEHAIKSVNYNYQYRLATTKIELRNLQTIYNLLLVQNEYRQELRDYEKAQLEKQHIAAQQAQAAAAASHAAAAHAQASALQQQAWQMAHQNQLHAAQIQVAQEQNYIQAQQLYAQQQAPVVVTVVNPVIQEDPEVHVYL